MVDKILGFLDEKVGVNIAVLLSIVGIILIGVIFSTTGFGASKIFGFAILLSPIWLPLVLFLLFFEFWQYYVRKYFNLEQGRVTLEILLPEEILKSPLAMELVLTHLHQTASPDNLVQTYWDGKNIPVFSLEIVSIGGTVRFFVNLVTRKYKNIFEAQLYSQYPGIEIREVPVDYTAEIDGALEEFDLFSMHFGISKADVYPIKTYIDYGLDKDPKEELKIDPLTQMLDMLGSISPHDRMWIQVLISIHRSLICER